MKFISLLLLILSTYVLPVSSSIEIQDMQVEYTHEPLGIDVEKPRFSWKMIDKEHNRGSKQTAYRIRVWEDNTEKEVWDSGKLKDGGSLNITYEGLALKPETRYTWQVSIWDQKGKSHTQDSWFETALLSPSIDAWSGAKWIGAGDDMVLYPDYLPVFKLSLTVKTRDKATFIYGADDPRLLSRNKNLYQIESAEGESYIAIELDVSPITRSRKAMLNVYRSGYTPQDQSKIPFKQFEIPNELINKFNRFEAHTLFLNSNLGSTQIYVGADLPQNKVGELNLNPLGEGGDFIAFPVVASIGFKVPQKETAYFSNIKISHFRSPSNVIFTENLDQGDYSGIFKGNPNLRVENKTYVVHSGSTKTLILAKPKVTAMPMLRTAFSTKTSKIKKARLYATARGIYDVYLNGKRVNDSYFNPGSTQYNKTHLYQTFDVTQLIEGGSNALGAILGEGWWSGAATFRGENWNFFGDRQSFLAKLVITYEDGTEERIVSEPNTWKYFSEGPLLYGSFFQGEVYDARRKEAIQNWSTAGYNASAWEDASEIGLDGKTSDVWENEDYALRSQFENPVRKLTELQAISVEEIRPCVFIYDMGQNMVGVPNITLPKMESGKTITLRYAEVKYPDLPEYKALTGMIMLENIRAAMAQDLYITSGYQDRIAPRFTFHGFRFLEITGIDQALPLNEVKASVLSSIDQLDSHYETSNKQVNKLWENITWSTFGNFLSIPTDCPQRNERLGWSGDISVFAETATYLSNMPQFLRKHMFAMRDVQNEAGKFPDVAPTGYGFGGLIWGSAGITVAWESYQQYADLRMLGEHYQAMKRYLDFIKNNYIDPESNLLVQNRVWSDLGDWLGPEQEKNDNSLLWEAYYLYDLSLMQKIAEVLNKREDLKSFKNSYNERFKLFKDTYIDKESKKTIHSSFTSKAGTPADTQTSYILPLSFNLIDPADTDAFVNNLLKTIEKERIADNGKVMPPYSLMTGFIGTASINSVLSDYGHPEVAYTLLQQTSYPSWIYPIEQGATTIWERLNSYTKEEGFGGNNRMNSFNHYSFGAIGAWLYTHSLGIARDEKSPGFKHFILQPEPDPTNQMTFAKGFYDSMYGKIESSWSRTDVGIHYRFTVPANTSATLLLAGTKESIKFTNQSGVLWIGSKNTKQIYQLTSGTFNVKVNEN